MWSFSWWHVGFAIYITSSGKSCVFSFDWSSGYHAKVVIKNTEFAYDKILSEYKKKISEQIKVKESQSENLEKEVEQLESRIGLLSGFVSELQN